MASRAGARPGVACPYLLLAEFDIDRGSLVKHIYPEAFETDEALADLMLPDGAHLRSEDWTIFYLDSPSAAPLSGKKDALKRSSTTSSKRSSLEPVEARQLLYVLNLVRTKKDETAKRGARVKALAVGSIHPWIQVYKPVLLLALDSYFADPTVDTLARIYQAVNALDLSSMPRLSRDEQLVLRHSDRTDLFEERFVEDAGLPVPSRGNSELGLSDDDWHSTASQAVGDNASSPDSREASPHSAMAEDALGSMLKRPSDAPALASQSATATISPARRPKDTHFFDSKIAYDGVSLPIRIPLTTFPEEVGDYSLISLIQAFSSPTALSTTGPLHPHLHTNGHATPPIILLFNALVTGKRVVFLGNGQAAGAVAAHVLAACALASGGGSVLQGFAERAFPYSHLAMLEKHDDTAGAIIGVTNPIFEELSSKWDVLCNVETGRIIVSKDLKASVPQGRPFSPTNSEGSGVLSPISGNLPFSSSLSATSGEDATKPGVGTKDGTAGAASRAAESSFDVGFMEEITAAIQAHDGEAVIRARFTDYVLRFVRLASRYEEDSFGSTSIGFSTRAGTAQQLGSGPYVLDSKELALNAPRIEGWRNTKSYLLYQAAFRREREMKAVSGIDLSHQLGRLRTARRMSAGEAALIFETLSAAIQTEEQIMELLSHMPAHTEGILPLALGLFHTQVAARYATVDLLTTISRNRTGHKLVSSLNALQRAALLRLLSERPSQQNLNHVNGTA